MGCRGGLYLPADRPGDDLPLAVHMQLPVNILDMLTDSLQRDAQAVGLSVRLLLGVPEASLRREYRGRIWRLAKSRWSPAVILGYVILCAIHYHAHTMARQIAGGKTRIYNSG